MKKNLFFNCHNFVAAPVSENQNVETPVTEQSSEMNDCLISGEEIREFLMPIVGPYFKKDEDLIVLESMHTDPPKDHYINEVDVCL